MLLASWHCCHQPSTNHWQECRQKVVSRMNGLAPTATMGHGKDRQQGTCNGMLPLTL